MPIYTLTIVTVIDTYSEKKVATYGNRWHYAAR